MNELQVRTSSEMVTEVKTRMAALHELMRDVLVEGIDADYAVIPGTHKRTLLLPGAQKIAAMFRFVPSYSLVDMSTANESRYRVTCTLSGPDGQVLGDATAEWSSAETNNQWRKSNSDEEYDDTPEDERRIVNKKASGGGTYKQKQIRVSRADSAIKGVAMAEKRAFIRVVRTASAASAIFTVHAEDLPEGMVSGESRQERAPVQRPQAKQSAPTTEQTVEELIGTVTGIKERKGTVKDPNKVYWFINIDGQDYGCFDSDIAAFCQPGTTIMYTWKSGTKEGARNLVTAAPCSEASE